MTLLLIWGSSLGLSQVSPTRSFFKNSQSKAANRIRSTAKITSTVTSPDLARFPSHRAGRGRRPDATDSALTALGRSAGSAGWGRLRWPQPVRSISRTCCWTPQRRSAFNKHLILCRLGWFCIDSRGQWRFGARQVSEVVVVEDALYSIGQASKLLDIPAPTIRSWERRYGVQPTGRTRAGHRRYSTADIAALQRMRDELDAGLKAQEAAAIARSLPSATPALLGQAVCAAAHRLDDTAISDVLDLARRLHGLSDTVDLVLLPAMQELGRQWSVGKCDVAHEHLATAAAQAWLTHAGSAEQPVGERHRVVLACAPAEQHTLALDALAALLADAGVRCLHLGARVPATSLRTAVECSGAGAVVITCQLTRHHRSALAAAQALEGTGATVCYAGAAFAAPDSRRDMPGHYLGTSLKQASEDLVGMTTQTANVVPAPPNPPGRPVRSG